LGAKYSNLEIIVSIGLYTEYWFQRLNGDIYDDD